MILLFVAFTLTASGCHPVGSERITAKDFADAVPEFSVLPVGVSLGFAPAPGSQRNFTGGDVQRLAKQYGIETKAQDAVCFEWPMRRLARTEVEKALRDALGQDGFQLDEYSLFSVPPGEIMFPLSGLTRQPKGTSFWRGYVQFAADKRFNIWAKVRFAEGAADRSRPDVLGGNKVTVMVRNGAAELTLEALAMTSGSKGQTVTVRNPSSGRTFVAEVTGKDSVFVGLGEAKQ